MIIKPRTRGFICTTAHPEGCARQVDQQIQYVLNKPAIHGPKNVLIIGASTGYGLASRIVAAFGAKANTVGVYRQSTASEKRTASAGWYHSAAFEKAAQAAGLTSFSVTGDAFTNETKHKTAELIRSNLGQVDMVIYSVATARRTDPVTSESRTSVLKPIGNSYTNKTVNFHTGEITDITLEPATEQEIADTVNVMGGEDWQQWIKVLTEAGVMAQNAVTVAFSYIGSQITMPIYREGTIGRAKDHLEETARELDKYLSDNGGGHAYVVVSKALVTQSSSAIPIVPLYMSILYKTMKEKGIHEGTIEQMYRLFADRLFSEQAVPVDEEGRIRLDDWEMREDVQAEVTQLWDRLSSDNVYELSDLEGFRQEFFQLFGFEVDGIDYEADTHPIVDMPNVY